MIQKNKAGEEAPKEFESDFADVSEVFNVCLPDPDSVEHYRRLKNRELFLNEDIEDSTINIALYIRKWNREDFGIPVKERKPIMIFIHTCGGTVDVASHIADMIMLSQTPVYTIGMGRVYSAGVLLLIAGHKRYVFPNTRCLIHDGSVRIEDSIGKTMDNLDFIRCEEEMNKKYILSRTNIPEELYDQNYRGDWYLFSDEMIRLGIADEIVTDISSIL